MTAPADETLGLAEHRGRERGRLVDNILSLGTGAVLAKVAVFLGTAYLARVLGPEGFGVIGFAAALATYFAVGVQGGFPDTGIREVSRRPADAAAIAASAIVVRVGIALVALAALAAVALLLPKSPTVKLVTILTGLTFFTIALDTSWVYMGLARNRSVGLALVFSQLGYVAVILLAVHRPSDVQLVPIAQFVGELAAALFLLLPLVSHTRFRVDLAAGWSLVRGTGSLTVTRFLRTFVFTLDVLMIGYYMSDGPVGLYSSGYRICNMVMIVVGSVHAAYLPALTQAAKQGIEDVRAIAQRSVDVTVVLAAPIIVGGAILARPLLIAIFGADFAAGADPFRLLLSTFGLILVSMTVHDVILVYERMRVEVWIVGAAAILNALLNVVLIPRYGLMGAASATLAAELLILAGGLVVISGLGIRLVFNGSLRPLAAAGLMGAALLLIGTDRSIVLLVPAGGLVYFVSLAALGGIPRDGWPMLGRVLEPLLGRAR